MTRAIRFLLLLLLFLIVTDVAYGLDGRRRGFTIAGSAGIGGTSFHQDEVFGSKTLWSGVTITEPTFTNDFRLGFGATDRFLLYYFLHAAWFRHKPADDDERIVGTTVTGFGLAHFLSPQSPSVVLMEGIGFSTWADPYDDPFDRGVGFGLWGSIGYEFQTHLVASISISHGAPEWRDGPSQIRTSATAFSAELTYWGY